MKVFIGWDPLDIDAYKVCEASLKHYSSIPLEIQPVMEHRCRQAGVFWRSYRMDDKGQRWDDRDGRPFSTGFSFTRFCVPALCDYSDEWVLFMDPDMLVCADIAELFAMADDKALYCVQHNHYPTEETKMGGLLQTQYRRKNWSSLMLLNPALNRSLTKYVINNNTGSWLHAMLWLRDEEIGAIDEAWNWLEGYTEPQTKPKIIHYTRGTPDLPGCEDVMYADRWFRAREGDYKYPVQAVA